MAGAGLFDRLSRGTRLGGGWPELPLAPVVLLPAPVAAPVVLAAGAPVTGWPEVPGLVECVAPPEDPGPAPVCVGEPCDLRLELECPAVPRPFAAAPIPRTDPAATDDRPVIDPEAALRAPPRTGVPPGTPPPRTAGADDGRRGLATNRAAERKEPGREDAETGEPGTQ